MVFFKNVALILVFAFLCICVQDCFGDNFCNENKTIIIETNCRKCYRNYRTRCPDGTTKLTRGRGDATCYVPASVWGHKHRIRGCQHKCEQPIEIKKCCTGSWGIDCDACPSIYNIKLNRPCSGNGICNDTIDGNGQCTCQENFTGYACEQCIDKKKYGKSCDKDCHCVHGTCENGIRGDGSCDCDSGYNGTRCDQELEACKNKTCPKNSKCKDVFGWVMCTCDQWYKRMYISTHDAGKDLNGTDGTTVGNNETEVKNSHECVPIDACTESSFKPCHDNASCTTVGPGKVNCSCLTGYHGDGYVCDPIDPCQVDNGGCDTNRSRCRYAGPGEHTCECLRGYEMDLQLQTCEMIDVCSINASYCSEYATCSVIGPLQFDCSCNEGYGGDGISCYNNIADLIKDLNNFGDNEVKGKMNYASQLVSEHYYKELRNNGPFTLFIPTDGGFRTVLGRQSFEEFVADADTAKQVLRQHILVGEWTLDKLAEASDVYTLQGIPANIQAKTKHGDLFYRYKLPGSVGQRASKTTVIKENIIAANGVVHVIGKMLTKNPEVKGDPKRSILDLIKAEEKYSRLESLIEKAGMTTHVKATNITMFTPENSAWDSLPDNAMDHFTSPEGVESLRQILLNHIFDGVIEAAELIELDRIKSHAGVEIAVNVTEKGQIVLNQNISIAQTDIPAKNGLYHHIKSVLLPAHINSLLPSQCDEEMSELVVGPCGPCINTDDLTCPSSTDVPIKNEVRTGCTYSIYTISQRGCAQVCNRTHIKKQCCTNFYSIECYPCPGGFQNPCSDNGQCSDGVNGNGTCMCDTGFTGTLCNQCEDPNKFGPYCNQTCTCQKGTCKNTIDGDGTCKHCKNYLFKGDNCDMKQMFCRPRLWTTLYSSGFCHLNAYCDSSYRCKCQQGYEGKYINSDLICSEIDNCQLPDRGGCHLQARCIKTGPGDNICKCEAGWVGDGNFCYRSVQCNSHRDCHVNGRCKPHWTNTQSLCECRKDFHGNGTYCIPNDPCTVNNGNCHRKADCTTVGLGNHTCTCKMGYTGNGYVCIPTIYKVIEEDARLSKLLGFLQKLGNEDLLLSTTDNYTFFAPNDNAMDVVISRMESSYWDEADNILNFIRFHTLPGLYSIKMLLSYQKTHIRMETLYDGFSLSVFNFNNESFVGAYEDTKILSGFLDQDIPAVNGYVHIITKALEPFFPSSDTPMLDEFFNSHSEYSQFGDWLEMRGIIDNIMLNMNQYTLLVPQNSAMVGHNISFVQSRYLKFYVLPRIRLLSSFENGETIPTVLGITQQLKFTRIGSKVYVNNILISAPNMLTAGGVVHGIDGLLSPILHQCNITQVNTVFGPCKACSIGYYLCPEGYEQVDKNDLIKDCYYPYHDGYSRKGCRGLCEQRTLVPECCHGYFGPNCQECPGGAEFPCNNNGVCHNGINGTGVCLCKSGFNGTACEFRDVNGTLQAWSLSCLYNNGGCSPNATCEVAQSGRVICTCFPGLVGDGSQCQNPCDQDNGGCHINAQCIFIEGYGRNCSCYDGFQGNGQVCTQMLKMSRSPAVWIYVVSVLVAVIVLTILAFTGVFIYLRHMNTSGIFQVMKFSRKDSVNELLQPDDKENEFMVSQPSPPPDINFCNPLYNVNEEFNDM